MSVFRVHMTFPMDGNLPRDKIQYTPHYNGADAQALANALKTNLIAQPNVATAPFDIAVYDAKKAPPSYPLAVASQTGTAPVTTNPREIALCLSYYAQYNRPTFRGRFYLCLKHLNIATPALRPTTANQQAAIAWKSVFGAGLPPGTFWVVYSKKTGGDAQVTNVWCDDEWDTQRRRGLKGSTRQLGTVP